MLLPEPARENVCTGWVFADPVGNTGLRIVAGALALAVSLGTNVLDGADAFCGGEPEPDLWVEELLREKGFRRTSLVFGLDTLRVTLPLLET